MQNVLYKTAFIYCFKTWSLRAKAHESGILCPVVGLGICVLSTRRKAGRKEGKEEGKKEGRKKWKRLKTENVIVFMK
jgi:hypothetical protein